MTPSDQWFRSYDYGFIHRGVMLWWRLLGDGRLHIAREYVHQRTSIAEICRNVRAISRDLRMTGCRYTVADKFSMGSRHSDESGETRADLFRTHGISIIPANHDRVQGWTRVRELLAPRPDHLPWLTIDPSCRYLIRTLAAAVSDRHNPEDVAESKDDHALSALRYGAMSRPSPSRLSTPPLPRHAAGRLLAEVRSPASDSPYRTVVR